MPSGHNSLDIYWEKQGNEIADFEPLSNRGPGYSINSATEEDAGVYYAYFRDWRNAFSGSLFRVIVRGKSCYKTVIYGNYPNHNKIAKS